MDHQKSFVVPVLDYSPASQYNINTLLEDLKDVSGELILVFNNESVANDLKNHPRVDYYAIMSTNVGVSRAWNIGLNISRTSIVFILNSDLHISKNAINEVMSYISQLDHAAMVGPQGAFFDFSSLSDHIYFPKDTFTEPIEVDAVSGFFFALNKTLLDEHKISFDNQFTPCYQEEWDIGLQIKRAGLKSYAVPVNNFDHEWSGSIRAYKKIKFYDESLTPDEILSNNKIKFTKKWEVISKSMPKNFLESKLRDWVVLEATKKINAGERGIPKDFYEYLRKVFGRDQEVMALLEKII
jgi:GT2 family glycosyltransferase